MEEDAPDFSYAYAGTSMPAAPSWNPALRPENEATESQMAHQLQPSPQIIPQSKPSLEDGQEESDDDVPTMPDASATPALAINGVAHDPESGHFDRDDKSEGSGDDEGEEEESEDEADEADESESEQPSSDEASETNRQEEDHLAAAAGRLTLGDKVAEDGHPDVNEASHTLSEPSRDNQAASAEEHPEQNYEHQGEPTALESAVAGSESAPLVADAEDDWGASGEVFDLGGAPQDAPVETSPRAPNPEAGGATVGDEVIGNTKVGGNTREDDWGDGDGDDFFGIAAASQPVEPAQSAEGNVGVHEVQKSGEKAAAGSDPMWDLDMDNDFLPDTEEAAPLIELDDDEGFLEDEPSTTSQQPVQPVSAPNTSRYAPAAAQTPQPAANLYGLPTPQLTNFAPQASHTPSVPTPSALYNPYAPPAPYQQVPSRPEMPSSTESFVAKARGGYHSPYDLPEDIVTTRRRPAPRTASVPTAPPSAPPRSSSMSGTALPHPPPPVPSLSPPSSSHSAQAQITGLVSDVPPQPAVLTKAPSNDFFAELPITTKPRASGRYTPQSGAPQQPQTQVFPPKERTSSWSSLKNEFRPDSDNIISQLQQAERLPAFPDQPTAPVRANSLPVPQPVPAAASNRYSPAPAANARYSPAPPSAPTSHARYSPAPPPQGQVSHPPTQYASPALPGPPRPPSQTYAPRTSSPLAYHARPQQPEQPTHVPEPPVDNPRSALEGVSETEEQPQQFVASPPATARSATPPVRSRPSSAVSSPRKRSNYAPQYQSVTPSTTSMPLQPGSPSTSMKQPARSFSNVEPPSSTFGTTFQPTYDTPDSHNVNVIPPRRQASLQYECIAPTDERAADPLERWRGYPIFKWGLGGTVVTTFPKQVPRYGGGASAPMVKCCPGEIQLSSAKGVSPLPEYIAKFPGPLKTKSKKKDVTAWLDQRIRALEEHLHPPGLDQTQSADELKRLEEKVLLWKVLQILIDNDGILDGNATVDAAIRKVFSSDAEVSTDDEPSLTTAADLVGRPRSNTTGVQADPVDPKAVEELRTLLVKGDREKAVWNAVDQRLWAHAMLLSSTLSKDVWKQVVQEFVQKEVKKLGRNNQALAVLYEIFAGNHDDCIDELVPASARAGFQMMSTDGAGSTQNALQGLDKWRETLSLVLNNRSEGDAAALVSLGKLLAGYGRVEAAHICFIFARSKARINGVDDPEANIVLVGADHKLNPLELGIDMEPVLLTEVYEYGLSLSAPGGSHIIPHLQNYKLAHAYQLAEYGHHTDAQAYCDAIAASVKATTRISPYYNGTFVTMLDDLSKRLSQSPKDGTSSWISKPSMDKVSSSLLSKFNSFIAGDDEDAASNHSAGEAGPFAGAGTLTPVQSSADLYGAYSGFGISAGAPAAPSNPKYAPSNAHAPRTSMESTRSKYEPQGRPSLESSDGSVGMRAVSDPHFRSPQFPHSFTPSQPQLSSAAQQPSLSKSHSYSPLRSEYNASEPSHGNSYQPAPAEEVPAPSYGGFQPPSSSYGPSTYQPYQPNENELPDQSLKPKKSIMDLDDDDDDLAARAAALKSKTKSDVDRQADEAFRKAAEEDAKRDKEAATAKKSGGWFGGWFRKDDNAAPKPIKAKLGEENSFKYDPELKKWVNTKAGASETSKPAATPPPPRGGPPGRSASSAAAMGPPSSLPNAPANGLTLPPTSSPALRSSSMPPPMGVPGSRASTPGIPSDTEGGKPPALVRPNLPTGPPSRPGTGMSTASSIDDLLGAPQARKGAAGKAKKKGGRYVDVMAKS